MRTNIVNIDDENYKNEDLQRTYHRDLAERRINDSSIDRNVRLRDEYFLNLEDLSLSRTETKDKIESYNEEVNQSRVNDDDLYKKMISKYEVHFDKLNTILDDIDKSSKEYEDIRKAEQLLQNLYMNLEDSEFISEENFINLTNSNLDNALNMQFENDGNYNIEYKEFIENNNKEFEKYNYSQEEQIDNKVKNKKKTQQDTSDNSLNQDNQDFKVISQNQNNKDRKMVETKDSIYFLGQEFSNFHKANFTIKDIQFNSSEQAFMFSKAKHFNDEETANKILESNSPSESKKLGRQVKNFDEKEWNKVSEKYMNIILKHKFEDNEHLKNMLLDTNEKQIVECSPFDKKWGIGINVDEAVNGKEWKGENKLGNSLMTVRDNILLEERAFKNDNIKDIQQDNSDKKELLETLKKNKEFVDKVDKDNSTKQENNENKIMQLSQELEYSNENLYNQSYETKNAISELSFKEKMDLYNQAKDIDNITDYDTQNNINDISHQLQTKLIINEIEKTNDSEMLNSLRKDYLVSDTPKPATKDLSFENSNLSSYLENSNKEISNLNKPKLDKFIENANNEIKHINYNEQSNKIKNNKVFKQYYSSDKTQSQSQNKANENKEFNQRDEEKEEKSKEKKNKLQR